MSVNQGETVMMRMLRTLSGLACVALIAASAVAATPLGTGFTYQGKIQKSGQPYSGTAQLLIRLFDSVSGGTQIGPDANLANVPVAGGLFTVELDYGAGAFNGDARWLEIQVKTSGDAGYTLLTPRQKVTATPYSMFSTSGSGGGGYWVYNSGYLTYSGGNVAVTGRYDTPPTSGMGVYLEGGFPDAGYLWSYNYNTNTPTTLYINPQGGRVAVGSYNAYGKFTSVSSTDAAIVGVHTGNWVGVYGESNSSVGVWGKSATGIGVQGETAAAYNGGIIGYASNAAGWGGYFKNTAGGVALLADGKAQVRSLDILGGADIVEGFETGGESLQPGTVVVIDEAHPGELRASRAAYDHRVAGVVSGAGGISPGLKLGQQGALDGRTPIAMTGRVYVRCSAENGVIRPGDLLTTAGKTGCAMRAADPSRSYGAVLGKAMSALDSGTGLVLVLVNLQ
jgi:hypothetical protein